MGSAVLIMGALFPVKTPDGAGAVAGSMTVLSNGICICWWHVVIMIWANSELTAGKVCGH
jgi:hypothetical protein